MNKKFKKIIAPSIITLLLILIFIVYITVWVIIPIPTIIRIIGVTINLGLIGVSIFVLIERIKEIRSGEEDDLSKY